MQKKLLKREALRNRNIRFVQHARKSPCPRRKGDCRSENRKSSQSHGQVRRYPIPLIRFLFAPLRKSAACSIVRIECFGVHIVVQVCSALLSCCNTPSLARPPGAAHHLKAEAAPSPALKSCIELRSMVFHQKNASLTR